jgi:hypothetical protein
VRAAGEAGPSGHAFGAGAACLHAPAPFPDLRLSIFAPDRRLVGGIDEKTGLPKDQFSAPHGICVDSRGDVYVGEVSFTVWSSYTHPGEPHPKKLRSLQKLVSVAA